MHAVLSKRTSAFSVAQNLSIYCKNPKLKRKAYNTGDSQVVTHQKKSTNPAQHCLTSVIRPELVLSVWYGQRCLNVQWRKNLKSIEQMIFLHK